MQRCSGLTDAGLAQLAGLEALDMSSNPQLDGSAFQALGPSLLRLTMRRCTGVLDSSLSLLPYLLELDVESCSQLTDTAFSQLRGLQVLRMPNCSQSGLSGAALACCAGSILSLDMSFCSQEGIRDSDLAQLAGIRELIMHGCTQLSDAAFEHLKGLHTLTMSACTQSSITEAAFQHLSGLHTLDISGCSIPGAALRHLGSSLRELYADSCWHEGWGVASSAEESSAPAAAAAPTFSDADFAQLTGLHILSLDNSFDISDAGLAPLMGQLRSLNISGNSAVTGASFQGPLPHLRSLTAENVSPALQDALLALRSGPYLRLGCTENQDYHCSYCSGDFEEHMREGGESPLSEKDEDFERYNLDSPHESDNEPLTDLSSMLEQDRYALLVRGDMWHSGDWDGEGGVYLRSRRSRKAEKIGSGEPEELQGLEGSAAATAAKEERWLQRHELRARKAEARAKNKRHREPKFSKPQ